MIVFFRRSATDPKKYLVLISLWAAAHFSLLQPFRLGDSMYMIVRKGGKDIVCFLFFPKHVFSAWCNTAATVYRKYGNNLWLSIWQCMPLGLEFHYNCVGIWRAVFPLAQFIMWYYVSEKDRWFHFWLGYPMLHMFLVTGMCLERDLVYLSWALGI